MELWNRTDLDKLNRVWDAPKAGTIPARPYVNRSQIPVSDLTDAELADPNVPKKLTSLPGLAYAVPVKDVGQDSEADDLEPWETEPGPGTAQRGVLARHTWSATITGRVLTEQLNGSSSSIRASFPLAVTGIRVELWDKDGLWDDFLGSAHTDDDGRFSIAFNNSQGSEGSYLDLYLKIEATTAGGTIRVIKRVGITRNGTCGRSNPRGLHYNTTSLNLGDVSPSHDDVKPHLLHYAWQSRKFMEISELGGVLPNSSSKPLEIMISPIIAGQDAAFFLPGGYRNAGAGTLFTLFSLGGPIGVGVGVATAAGMALYLSNQDCLYIGENEETEETAYHEFGHYAMWHMQNRSWPNALEASFARHSYETNASNPKIAWTEGWANGFAMIMDAYTVRYDGERGQDEVARGSEVRALLERDEYNVSRNGNVNPEFTLTKGYLSEYFIGTTLYDLWDSSANLALRSSSPSAATATGSGAPTGSANAFTAFDDNNASNDFRDQGILDEAGLSFLQLTAPIRSHPGNGVWGVGQFSPTVVQDIPDYFRYLLQVQGECEQRRMLANVFLINRISDFPGQAGLQLFAPTQRLGTDEIQRSLTMTEPLFKLKEDDYYHGNGVETFTVTLDCNELAGAAASYNLAATTATGAGSLSDPLTVSGGARLGVNAGAERGYAGSGQAVPAGSRYTAELCGRMRLVLARDGKLELGEPARQATATAALTDGGLLEVQAGGTARVSAGSVLTIRRGATLVVRNGGTLLAEGQVRVESGGFLCVEAGANLVFSPAAELYVDAAATLGTNPVLRLASGTGCSGQLTVCGRLTGGHAGITNRGTRNEALRFDGNDVVAIANTNSWVNHSLSQEFAIEAFIRAENLGAASGQTIFSSRHRSTAPTAFAGYDGILFSVYGGQLLLQLGGRNYYTAANTLPNDNGCHHVAVTRDNVNRVRFYIDGQETSYSPTTSLNARSAGNLNLGADLVDNTLYGEHFLGLLGEVRVWNGWRSGDQLRQYQTAKLAAPQSGLVGYYDMQDAAGSQQLSDLSGVNDTGQPLVPGTLGATAAPAPDDPTWVTYCALACTVQGNFRAAPLRWAAPDSASHLTAKLQRQARPAAAAAPGVRIFPNPTREAATVELTQPAEGRVRVWVQDIAGAERLVVTREQLLAAGRHQLPVSTRALAPGLYLLVVQCNGARQYTRFLVN